MFAHSPMQMWKTSGEYKSSIAHPFGEYDFHFLELVKHTLVCESLEEFFWAGEAFLGQVKMTPGEHILRITCACLNG